MSNVLAGSAPASRAVCHRALLLGRAELSCSRGGGGSTDCLGERSLPSHLAVRGELLLLVGAFPVSWLAWGMSVACSSGILTHRPSSPEKQVLCSVPGRLR